MTPSAILSLLLHRHSEFRTLHVSHSMTTNRNHAFVASKRALSTADAAIVRAYARSLGVVPRAYLVCAGRDRTVLPLSLANQNSHRHGLLSFEDRIKSVSYHQNTQVFGTIPQLPLRLLYGDNLRRLE